MYDNISANPGRRHSSNDTVLFTAELTLDICRTRDLKTYKMKMEMKMINRIVRMARFSIV